MTERFDALILGSGNGGMYLAWHLAQSGQRTAVVERRWIVGSCPNINCLPTKNEISSAKVVDLARHAETFGLNTGVVTVDMEGVRPRKRDMVDYMIDGTRKQYENSGAELVMGSGRFVAPRTLEVQLNDGGTRTMTADRVFLNLGTHAALPDVPGLADAQPMTNIELLELDYCPSPFDRPGWWLRRHRTGTGLPPVRQSRDDRPARYADRRPGRRGRRRRATTPAVRRGHRRHRIGRSGRGVRPLRQRGDR